MLLVSWIVNGYVCFNTADRAMYQRNNQNIAAPSYLVIKYEAKAGDVELSLEKKKKRASNHDKLPALFERKWNVFTKANAQKLTRDPLFEQFT